MAAVVAVGCGFAPWLLEWREARRERRLKIEYAADRLAVFDLRSEEEFIRDLRGKGTEVYPVFARARLAGAGLKVLPLGSIANVDTVLGNESGEYLVYRSDEHGFHNPPGRWGLERVDVALVGDGFAQGASVPSPSNLAAMIRLRYPATLNLGHAGNGPLSELGSLLEYLPARRPRVVLWAYSAAGDLTDDLEGEKRCEQLRGYLARPPRLQGLERRQAEIDAALKGLAYKRAARTPGAEPDFKTFSEALEIARDAVAEWGGRLAFVYLPERRPSPYRAETLEVCRRLGLPVLDIERRFAAEKDRFEDYFYSFGGHYTETGYRRAGQMIAEELDCVLVSRFE